MEPSIKDSLKKLHKNSWFITLFATTLGVLLAFYLNNLGERLKIENRKQISIQNLNKELTNNKAELMDSENNNHLIEFLNAIKKIDAKIPNELRISLDRINALRQSYSDILIVNDSTKIDNDHFAYDVNYRFDITLDELHSIAWETAKMSNITNELDYECLQILVRIYSLQEIYTQEQQKVLNYFVNAEHTKLLNAMRIVQQFESQLLDAIIEGQEKVKECS